MKKCIGFSALILLFVVTLAVPGMAVITPQFIVVDQAGYPCDMSNAVFPVGDHLSVNDTSIINGETILQRTWTITGPTSVPDSSLQNYTLPALSIGDYYVTLNLIGSSSTATLPGKLLKIVPVSDQISANFTWAVRPDSVPNDLSLIDLSQANNSLIKDWSWAVDSERISVSQSPNITLSEGTHVVSLTVVDEDDAKSSVTKEIPIPSFPPVSVPKPAIEATPNPVLPGEDVTFYSINFPPDSWEDSWYWDFGDGQTSPLRTPNHAYSTPGRYTVNLKASNSLGEGVADPVTVVVWNPVELTDFTASTYTGDFPLPVSFTVDISVNGKSNAESAPYVKTWFYYIYKLDGSYDEGGFLYDTLSNEQNPTYTFGKPGLYQVIVDCILFDGSPISPPDPLYITVGPNPYANYYWDYLTQDPTCCYLVKFTDSSYGSSSSWLWDFGDGATSTEPNPTHRFKEAGNYSVNLTINGGGLDSMKRVQTVPIADGYKVPDWTITPTPTPTAAPDTVKAEFSWVQTPAKEFSFYDASSKAVSRYWTFGDGESSTDKDPTHKYPFTNRYYHVTLKVWDSEGNSDTVSHGVYT